MFSTLPMTIFYTFKRHISLVVCKMHLILTSQKINGKWYRVNPLQDDKILDLHKLKAFADDKLNVTQNVKLVLHKIENIVRKEENAGYQHSLLFPQCFYKAFSSSVSEVVIVW